jgi:hypothetical protein
MRPIPPKMRQELEKLPRMKACTLSRLQSVYGHCEGKLDWHHVWIYAGRQINELWAILAGCQRHHRMVDSDAAIRASFQTASLALATDEDLAKYPRANWPQLKRALGMKV